MTRYALIATVLLAAARLAPAQPLVQIFMTNSADGYGLTHPENAFLPAIGPDLDPDTNGIQADDVTSGRYVVAAFPPLSADPNVTPTINYAAGEFAYIWVHFGGLIDWKICGFRLSQPNSADVAYYVVNDVAGDWFRKRWDGDYTLPGAPQFKQKINQVLAGVTAHGLLIRGGQNEDWNLFDHTKHTYLLGAVRYSQSGTYSIDIPNDYNGVNVNCSTTYVSRQIGSATWIPEPATLALIGLLTTLRRRGAGRP